MGDFLGRVMEVSQRDTQHLRQHKLIAAAPPPVHRPNAGWLRGQSKWTDWCRTSSRSRLSRARRTCHGSLSEVPPSGPNPREVDLPQLSPWTLACAHPPDAWRLSLGTVLYEKSKSLWFYVK